jgi:tRNA dimethylallyltransferase
MKQLLVICGPTATGKTNIAVRIAKQLRGELVSADSRQVYRDMDIGTGKDREEVGDIPLWMIDVARPDEEFSVSRYVKLAKPCIDHIRQRGALPVVVGGTGLYIDALLHPKETIDIPPNQQLRDQLSRFSIEALQKELQQRSPAVFSKLNASDRMNPRRLIRKIEIARASVPSAPVQQEATDVLCIGLYAPMQELYRRIDARVEKRVRQGIRQEIHALQQKGYDWNLPSMNTLGYKEWKDVTDPKQAIARWKYNEHAYARRQMTWFRAMKYIVWIDTTADSWQDEVTQKVLRWYTDASIV